MKIVKRKGSESMEENNQSLQQSNVQSMIFDQNQIKKNNAKKLGLIVGVVAIILIIAGGFLYYSYINNPTNVYKTLIKTGITELFDIAYQEDDKINASLDLDLDLKLEDGLIDESVIDLLNETELGFNYQLDKENKQLVLKIDADYDSDSLLDVEMFVDGKNEKTYVYLKDYIDKYLEINMDDYSSLTELFESDDLSLGQKINSEKAKDILIKEFTAVIKDEDCSKNGDAFIFKISEKELMERIKTAMTNLRNNEDFLDCYEDSDDLKESLDTVLEEVDPSIYSDEVVTFSITKDGSFSTKIKQFKMNYMEADCVFDVTKDKISYDFLTDNESVLKGYIKVEEQKNTETVELSLQIPEVGEIVIKLGASYTTGKDVEKIDASKAKSIEELTTEEQQEFMTNVQNSKLYELITLFSGSLNDYEDSFDTDLEENSTAVPNQITSYDDAVTIKLNIPEYFENYYSSENYQSYDYDNLDISFYMTHYDNEDEYLSELDSTLEYYNKQEYYKNGALSEKKTKTVAGRTYYYKDLTYDYIGIMDDTTKYYEKYLCTKIDENNYLIVEISSESSEISDSILETILTVK